MSSQEDPISAIYRQFQQAHTTEANVLEWYQTQLTEMKKKIQMQLGEITNLQKKVSELQPNTKKITQQVKKN